MSKQATSENWKIIKTSDFPIPITVREMTYLRATNAEFRNTLKEGNKKLLVQILFSAREQKDRPAAKKMTQ